MDIKTVLKAWTDNPCYETYRAIIITVWQERYPERLKTELPKLDANEWFMVFSANKNCRQKMSPAHDYYLENFHYPAVGTITKRRYYDRSTTRAHYRFYIDGRTIEVDSEDGKNFTLVEPNGKD